MSTNLNDYEGKSVFVVGTDALKDTGELAVYESFTDLNEHLKMLSPSSEPDILVLHGVLTSANYIPGEIGRHIYVLVQDPQDREAGCIYETECSRDINLLSEVISDTVAGNDCPCDNVTIDNVFILYGYELNTGYSVHEDEIDEEVIETCQNITEPVKEMRGRNESDGSDYDAYQSPAYKSIIESFDRRFARVPYSTP